ncbi:MAG: S9 family peptidase [Sphingomonadales bacterium]|jgi:dipeptidyl aminopeptidase/acylaminoacyl peptidase
MTTQMFARGGLVRALAMALLLTTGPLAARGLSADDLPKLVRIGDPQIAPDGKSVLGVVGRANLKDNRWDGELTLFDVATKASRVLSRRAGLNSVRWSPDGRSVAFLAQDANNRAQVHVLAMDGGDARQLTFGKTPVTQFAWRPDSQAIAFAAPEEEPEKTGDARFEDGFEVGNHSYLDRAPRRPIHVWTVAPADGATRRLTSGPRSLPLGLPPAGPPSQLNWTPDGTKLIFVQADTPATGDADSGRLVTLDVASGTVQPLLATGTRQDIPQLSPDGRSIAYVAPRDGQPAHQRRVFIAPVGGGAPRDAAPALDVAADLVGWMPDGETVVLGGTDGTGAGLWLAKGGKATRIDLGGLNPGSADIGPNGSIVFTATSADRPAELYLLPATGQPPVALTHLQTATDGLTLGRQETLTWKSDGFVADGVVTYPPDYKAGEKRPLVLYIHGGPVATSLQTFSTSAQILAAQGWIVFEPNYRGSNNRGYRYQQAIIGDAVAGPGRDIMAGVAELKRRGLVDDKRMAVTGWSYGGMMTSWLIGAYPAAWKAAVAGAPVTDIVDQYTTADSNRIRAGQYGPSPFVGDNMASYSRQSPIFQAWKARAPTLIMADVGDWRVTIPQAYKLYRALSDNKVPVKFIAFPVPGHSPADPIRSRDVWRRWTDWLKTWLGATPAP